MCFKKKNPKEPQKNKQKNVYLTYDAAIPLRKKDSAYTELCVAVQSSLICNSAKLDPAQMSINTRMDK